MCKAIEMTDKAGQRKARAAAEYAFRNRRYTYSDIFTAYAAPSAEKCRAWDRVKRLCADMGGRDLLISGRSSHFFSAVFKFTDETGAECYAWITPSYDRFCYA